jgi:hypothetical protein
MAQAADDFAGGMRGAVEQQQSELFAADAGQDVPGAELIAPDGGGLFEQSIPGGVAVSVVELFETIEVKHGDRELLPGVRVLAQSSLPGSAVGQTGQRIGERLIAEMIKCVSA